VFGCVCVCVWGGMGKGVGECATVFMCVCAYVCVYVRTNEYVCGVYVRLCVSMCV